MSNDFKTGWFPDPYDVNDYTLRTRKINTLIKQIQITRTCTDLLAVLQTFIDGPEDSDKSAAKEIQTNRSPYQELRDGAQRLQADLNAVLNGLIAGVDLISALPDAAAYREGIKPLPPPISFNIVNLLIENRVIYPQNHKVSFDSLEDEGLRFIRHILDQEMPLGRYKGISAIEEVVKQYIQEKVENPPSKDSSENCIKVNPETMYDLRLAKAESEIRLPLSEALSNQLKGREEKYYVLPDVVDLSYWCSGVKTQGEIHSCTSHAVASLVEYFQNRIAESANPNFTPSSVSARFLYKVTRRLAELNPEQKNKLKGFLQNSDLDEHALEDILQSLTTLSFRSSSQEKSERIDQLVKPDNRQEFIDCLFDPGASLRQTLKALQLFGVPSEKYWRYDPTFPSFDDEPPQFCYAFAQNFQAAKYFRLDFLNVKRPEEESVSEASGADDADMKRKRKLILAQIKAVLAAGFPAVCGFPYDPNQEDQRTGWIEFPSQDMLNASKEQLKNGRKASGEIVGHAVLVVGYNDSKQAFLFQNSYGESWGISGYGWLPYEFVLEGLATDWWSLLNAEWVETGHFGLDINLGDPQKTVGNI